MSNEILKKISIEMDLPEDASSEDTFEAICSLRDHLFSNIVHERQVKDELISIQNLISEHRYYRGLSIGVEELRILAAIEEKIQKLTL